MRHATFNIQIHSANFTVVREKVDKEHRCLNISAFRHLWCVRVRGLPRLMVLRRRSGTFCASIQSQAADETFSPVSMCTSYDLWPSGTWPRYAVGRRQIDYR